MVLPTGRDPEQCWSTQGVARAVMQAAMTLATAGVTPAATATACHCSYHELLLLLLLLTTACAGLLLCLLVELDAP